MKRLPISVGLYDFIRLSDFSTESRHWAKNTLTHSSNFVMILFSIHTSSHTYGINIGRFVAAFLAMFDKTYPATVLQISDFPFRDIENLAYFFQREPVSTASVPHLLIEGVNHIVQVCHTLQHGIEHFFFNLYYFDKRGI